MNIICPYDFIYNLHIILRTWNDEDNLCFMGLDWPMKQRCKQFWPEDLKMNMKPLRLSYNFKMAEEEGRRKTLSQVCLLGNEIITYICIGPEYISEQR